MDLNFKYFRCQENPSVVGYINHDQRQLSGCLTLFTYKSPMHNPKAELSAKTITKSYHSFFVVWDKNEVVL